jgi:proline iminopeptidase
MSLHPDLPPLREWPLTVSGGHVLHVREWGHDEGQPVLVLHGGPGSGAGSLLWRVFDPQRWRVIVPDQRGAGRSLPAGGVQANTTADLLDDITALRRHLGLAHWVIAGGSWGATLAMLAAAREPGSVAALCLRAPFLARREDIDAFFAACPQPLPALHADLHGCDPQRAEQAALLWWRWERQQAGLSGCGQADTAAVVQRFRIQSHYLVNGCFLTAPLLGQLPALANTPISIVHSDNDRVCAPAGTRALQSHWPHARMHWVAGAGHDAAHPALLAAWMRALANSLPQQP